MKERKLKVTYAPGTEPKDKIPRIVLQGKWLKELGFEVGEYVIVKKHNQKTLVITFND
jgi:hypothetical protein